MTLLTDNEIADRLKEISQVRVALDADPLALGISTLNKKLADIQLSKDRVSFLVTEALQNSNTAEVLFETLKGDHDRQLEILLATDSSVQAQKSAEMRNATAKQKIAEQVLRLHHAEIDLLKAQGYLKVLQSIYSNLESTNANLSRQITVIQLSTTVGEVQRGMVPAPGHLTKTY